MIDAIPTAWLFDQHVPLIYFVIALLTRPSQWSKQVRELISELWSGKNKPKSE